MEEVRVNKLFVKGLKAGFVSVKEVSAVFLGKYFKDKNSKEEKALEWLLSCLEQFRIRIVKDEIKKKPKDRTKSDVLEYSEKDFDGSYSFYLKEVRPHSLLNREEERRLFKALTKADEKSHMRIREKLVHFNLRLVISIAKQFVSKGIDYIDYEDLVQAGNIGLLTAIDKFDYRKGYKFSTYATHWIKQAISRTVDDEGKLIRLPVHEAELRRRIRRVSTRIFQEKGEIATIEEIALKLHLPTEIIKAALERMSKSTVSLEDLFIEDNKEYSAWEETISNKEKTPEKIYELLDLGRKIKKIVNTLPERNARIIRLRFGLDGGPPKTLEEIGDEYSLTRERVRQIIEKSLPLLQKKVRKILKHKEIFEIFLET